MVSSMRMCAPALVKPVHVGRVPQRQPVESCLRRPSFRLAAGSLKLNRIGADLARLSLSARREVRRVAHLVTRCGWGDPVEWKQVKVARTEPAAEGLCSISIEVGADLTKGYTTPGQYVQLRCAAEGKPAFIAIASAPGTSTSELEFLIKDVPGATAGELCQLAPGAVVEMSPVQGKGFDMSKAPSDVVKQVLVFATGSGISPIRALIEAGPEHGGLDAAARAAGVRLYYGAKSQASMAFKDRFVNWEKSGVTVIPVYSQEGEKRYVQDAFKDDKENMSDPGAVAVVLCGQKEMSQEVTEAVGAIGVAPEQLLSNF